MKLTKRFTTTALIGITCSMAAATQAQPGQNNGGLGDNVPNQAQGNNRRGGNLTPQQRREMRTEQIRTMLTNAGFNDTTLQNDVVAFATEQDTARQSLQQHFRRINQALRSNAVTDAQLTTILAEFRAAAEAEKTRRASAVKALDAKIEFSKKPRLDAMLMMMGLTGDEVSLLGNGGMGGRGGGRGGQGGFGGGFGGGQGGGGRQGGRGGRNNQNQNQ
jgi:uncharacterized membrane protein YgcG